MRRRRERAVKIRHGYRRRESGAVREILDVGRFHSQWDRGYSPVQVRCSIITFSSLYIRVVFFWRSCKPHSSGSGSQQKHLGTCRLFFASYSDAGRACGDFEKGVKFLLRNVVSTCVTGKDKIAGTRLRDSHLLTQHYQATKGPFF